MLNTITNPPLPARCTIIAAAMAGWLLVDAASAQEAKKAKKADQPSSAAKEADERPLMVVYALKHGNAAQIATMLQGCLADSKECKLTTNEEQDRLIVWGSRQVHDTVRQIIESIDQPRQNATLLKIFPLAYSNAEDIVNVLGALTDIKKTRVSVDNRTNSLIVSSDREQELKIVEALITRLDQAHAEHDRSRFGPSTTFYVRVVWLASGPDGGDAERPAEDLEQVLAELAKLGIDDVRQVAQTIVNVGMDGQFAVSCQPVYGERPAQWTIDGELEEADGAFRLRIRLSTSHGPHIVESAVGAIPQPEEDLVDLETDLVAPEGHYIVLGITPTGKTQSIFVVQITPRK